MNVLESTLRNEIPQFASFLSAYDQCSPEIQEIVREMSAIILDENTDSDDKMHAIDTFIEALWPGLATDALEHHQVLENSDEFKEASEALDRQESEFSDRVRKLMDEQGKNQDDLADVMGVTQPAIANILNRRCRPQQRTIARFAAALGVEASELWPDN